MESITNQYTVTINHLIVKNSNLLQKGTTSSTNVNDSPKLKVNNSLSMALAALDQVMKNSTNSDDEASADPFLQGMN